MNYYICGIHGTGCTCLWRQGIHGIEKIMDCGDPICVCGDIPISSMQYLEGQSQIGKGETEALFLQVLADSGFESLKSSKEG
jgi:hypothetical protein